MSHLLYPKSCVWKQFLLPRLGFRPNDSIWVSAHAAQYPLHPSEIFISASHLLPAVFMSSLPFACTSGSSGLAATFSLPCALVSSLHKQINLPHFYPVTSFTEQQRNENKWQSSHTYILEPVLFSVLLTKYQCRQESFMTIIGRTTVKHTKQHRMQTVMYALCKDLKGWHSSGQTLFQSNTNLFRCLAQSALRARGHRLNDTTDLSSTDSSPTNAELSIHEEISKV